MNTIRFPLLAAMAALSFSACAPITPEAAADQCEKRARAATGPTGNVTIGVSNQGPVLGGEIGITQDYLQGRDPQELYETCVREKTGQGPIRPLNLKG